MAAYRTLYRKWRPMTFDDVVGQPHITETLKNEIMSGRISHAYMFTGTRGTGKTSTAKILSRAVNCLNPQNGNPCNECEVCRGIMNDTLLDVVEMDAASNNGVENIRDIIDQVRYATASSKYKVYIIDEVHMLSAGAFNALLKTLEEPPEHVIFILATTEIHKVLPTILSRCQRFDFKNISSSDICGAVSDILNKEGINAEKEAVEYIAQLGNGSMRDALSITEQCLAYKNNNLTYADVTEILGTLDDSFLYKIAGFIANGDTAQAVVSFDSCISKGKNPSSFAEGLLGVMREILLYNLSPETLDIGSFKLSLLKETAPLFGKEKTVRCIEILSELLRDIKYVSSAQILVECAVVRLCNASFSDDYSAILDRIADLEKKASGFTAAAQNTVPIAPAQQAAAYTPTSPQVMGAESPRSNSETKITQNTAADSSRHTDSQSVTANGIIGKIIANWSEVKEKIQSLGKIRIFVALYDVRLRGEGNKLILEVPERDTLSLLSDKESIDCMRRVISEMFACDVQIECVYAEKGDSTAELKTDLFDNLAELSNNFPENFKIE